MTRKTIRSIIRPIIYKLFEIPKFIMVIIMLIAFILISPVILVFVALKLWLEEEPIISNCKKLVKFFIS